MSLLIQDGRTGNESRAALKSKIFQLLKSKNILGKVLFKCQILIERNFFFKEYLTVDKESIIRQLKKIPTIKVKPEKRRFLDIFNEEDIEEIKN